MTAKTELSEALEGSGNSSQHHTLRHRHNLANLEPKVVVTKVSVIYDGRVETL